MSRRLRVHHLIATLDRGGAEQQLTHLLCGLDRQRFEPSLTCLVRGGHHEERLREAGVPIDVLGKRPGLDLSVVPRLVGRLRELRPDILHCWLFTANAFGHVAGRLAGVPVLIASERGVEEGKGLLHALADRVVGRLTTCVVTNSEAGRLRVVEDWGVPEERTRVIRNAVDLSRFPPVDRSGRTGPLRLLLLGRLVRQKRVDVFLDALSILRAQGVPFEARVLGDGPLRAELAPRAAGLASLEPATDDVPAALAWADVLVSTSDWEGMPNVILEAMASGLPVVATRVPGTEEVVEDGVTGVLVTAGDAAAVAAGLSSVFGEPGRLEALARVARPAAMSRASAADVPERHAALYRAASRGRR